MGAPSCSDVAPDSRYSCEQQAGWGKCKESWMQGHCCKTCFNCKNCNGLRVAALRTVYQNGQLSSVWQDYSYNCQKNLRDQSQAYPGHQYSAHGDCSNWGALSFH